VLNDLDPDLMRFYRDIGSIDRCDIDQLSKDWDDLKARDGSLEACEFLAEVLCSYGSKKEHRGRSGNPLKICQTNAPRFHSYLLSYKERLSLVKLYNEDWQKVVEQYDAPATFFYLDPPYHNLQTERYRFQEDQLYRLADVLPRLKGKWLLSYNNDGEVRAAFRNFNIREVEFNYTLGKNAQVTKELIIANYTI